ncbi:olfactory receptor 52P1-like [Vipera latastei]
MARKSGVAPILSQIPPRNQEASAADRSCLPKGRSSCELKLPLADGWDSRTEGGLELGCEENGENHPRSSSGESCPQSKAKPEKASSDLSARKQEQGFPLGEWGGGLGWAKGISSSDSSKEGNKVMKKTINRNIPMFSNHSEFRPPIFLLTGFPGLEKLHFWISLPICSMYLVALTGNCTILFVIRTDQTLHSPMYYFLSMLALLDLGLSLATLPTMLSVLWFSHREIHFDPCLVQMFFIHTFSILESAVLLAMAVDRYVAICFPLRYNSFFNGSLVAKMEIAAVVRGTLLMCPCPFLIKRLSFCQTNVIHHTYCEHMAVVQLACGDTRINSAYGLSVALIVIGGDLLGIGLSYFFIVRAVLRLSSSEARFKAFGTCGSHLCVITISYSPALFSFFTYRFGHHVAPHVHILLANLYLLVPPMLNPIVYGVRTKEIREQVIRVFLPNKVIVKPRSV